MTGLAIQLGCGAFLLAEIWLLGRRSERRYERRRKELL